MRIRNPNLGGLARLIKRAFEHRVAVAASIVLLPVFGLPLLARPDRGWARRHFPASSGGPPTASTSICEIRTMRRQMSASRRTRWVCWPRTIRVGPVGRSCRCTSIDELPQLWNKFGAI